jgi:hypothetical protein
MDFEVGLQAGNERFKDLGSKVQKRNRLRLSGQYACTITIDGDPASCWCNDETNDNNVSSAEH